MIENTTEWAMPDQRSLENPSTPLSDPDEFLFDALGGQKSSSGVKVNDDTILTYSPIYRGVSLIADTLAKIPIRVLRRVQPSGKEPDKSHFAWKLVNRKPNDEQTAFVFKQQMQAQATLRGNAFAFIDRLGNGNANQMIPLPGRKVWPVRVDGVKLYLFDTGTEIRKLEAMNVLHIRGMGLDSLLGVDTVNKSSDSVGLGLAMQRYSGEFFANNARPSVAIEMEGTPDKTTIERLRSEWAKIHQGLSNSHKLAILTGGMKLNPFSAGAKESQLIESRKFSLVDVANWLKVPVHKVGGEGRTAFASLEQENRSFLDDSIDPWMTTWEEELEEKLLTEEEKESDSHVISFVRQKVLAADVQTQSNVLIQDVNNGLLNVDEARAIQDRPPLPDGEGQKFRMPANIIIIGDDEEPDDIEPVVDPDDDDDEDDDRTRRLKVSTTRAFVDAADRMARRLVISAKKAAKNHRKFGDWLEHIEAQHRQVVVEALTPTVEAMYDAHGGVDDDVNHLRSQAVNLAVNALFNDITKRLDDCHETAPHETFEADIHAAIEDFGFAARCEAVHRIKRHAEESKSWDGTIANDATEADT